MNLKNRLARLCDPGEMLNREFNEGGEFIFRCDMRPKATARRQELKLEPVHFRIVANLLRPNRHCQKPYFMLLFFVVLKP